MKSVPNWFCSPNSSNDLEYKLKKEMISGCIIIQIQMIKGLYAIEYLSSNIDTHTVVVPSYSTGI